ncbi:heterokaryon incompatibility protein-domain-containing protein [Bisporella sp. PMI_857]|nr:heterokaryon incompatibility protein-domain-containing protein [Bisporella sp. PMI_857]
MDQFNAVELQPQNESEDAPELPLPLKPTDRCIRLLEFDLSHNGETIQGHAAVHDLDSCERVDFDALSYCWGRTETPRCISLNGEEFPVTSNLFLALEQICRYQQIDANSSPRLWVDAICINQGDYAEKSHQVMLMRDIYANAKKVLAWVGEADDTSPLAFDTLHQFAFDGDVDAVRLSLEPDIEERRLAIQLFLEREYFFRMWIVQEVVAAREVIILCGPLSIDFDKMIFAMRRMTGSGFYAFSGAAANLTYVSHWRDAYHELGDSSDSEELDLRLFLDTRDRSATNARDKIYSLRGIARERISKGINVDYGASVEQVFTDFSKLILRVRPDLQILSAVMLRHRDGSELQLPSYVPDWTRPKYGGGFLQRYYRFKPTHLFRAGGETKPRVTSNPESNSISLEGLRLDTIRHVIPLRFLLTAGEGSRIFVTQETLQDLSSEAIVSEKYGFTAEPAWIAYLRTLTADRTALSPRICDNYRSQFFSEFSGVSLHTLETSPSDLPFSVWEKISKDVGTIIEDKAMFLTSQGYLGLGQEGFRAGDIVCLFSGGEVPFLVRDASQDSEKTGAFYFLSECYVHGVMDGEAMESSSREPLEQFILL